MKPWLWMALCLVCLAAAGCRANAYRTALEQESRQWEERYYIAQDRLEECQSMLDAAMDRGDCQADCAGGRFLPSQPSGGPSAQSKTPAALAPPSIQGLSDDGFQKSPPSSLQSPGKLEEVALPAGGLPLPATTVPDAVDPDSTAPPYNPGGSNELPGLEQDDLRPENPQPDLPGDKRDLDIKLPLDSSSDSRDVTRVELIAMSSDGYDADGRPGDDGIQFILQPQDDDGRPIAAAGPVSVVVVDPLPEGKSVRVARWDLSTRQTAGYFDRSPQGFHLKLPWPAKDPKHTKLRLFTRYMTFDGRKIEADKTIEVDIDGKRQTPGEKVAKPLRQIEQPYRYRETPRVAVQTPRQTDDSSSSRPPVSRRRPVWSPERR